jgi:hypothetical protein
MINRIAQSLIYGSMFGIAATVVIVLTLAPSPSGDMVAIPVDRVVLPTPQPTPVDETPEAEPEPQPEPKIEPKPEPPKPQAPKVLSVDPITGYAATKAAVVMISRPWCGPCQAFKNGPMPGQLVSQGWDFSVDENATAQAYPTYRVFDGNRWHTVKGVLTGLRLRMLLNPRYAPPVPTRERVQTRGVQWLLDGKLWTQEALIDHLADHPNHGYSREQLNGMTIGELDALHTRDHELGRSVVSRPKLFSRN